MPVVASADKGGRLQSSSSTAATIFMGGMDNFSLAISSRALRWERSGKARRIRVPSRDSILFFVDEFWPSLPARSVSLECSSQLGESSGGTPIGILFINVFFAV